MLYLAHMEKETQVYVISETGTNLVKIGISDNPRKRLLGLQTANPRKLVILATWQGGKSEESEYHYQFSEFRREGEWFELPSCVLKSLLRNKSSVLAKPVSKKPLDVDSPSLVLVALAHIDEVRRKPYKATSQKRLNWLRQQEPMLRAGGNREQQVANEIANVLRIYQPEPAQSVAPDTGAAQ